MGDSVSWAYEQERKEREARHRQRCIARKKKCNSVTLDKAITALLVELKKQQLTSITWSKIADLRKAWGLE